MTSKHFKIVLLLLLCSGVLSPLLPILLYPNVENNTLSVFVMYVPGLIFGVLFGLVNRWKVGTIFAFTLISGGAYFGAVQSAVRSVGFTGGYLAGGLSGTVGGTVGALLLALASKLLTKKQLNPADDVVSALVGGLVGAIFLPLYVRSMVGFSFGSPPAEAIQVALSYQIPAYVLWQVIVGARIYLVNEAAPNRR